MINFLDYVFPFVEATVCTVVLLFVGFRLGKKSANKNYELELAAMIKELINKKIIDEEKFVSLVKEKSKLIQERMNKGKIK